MSMICFSRKLNIFVCVRDWVKHSMKCLDASVRPYSSISEKFAQQENVLSLAITTVKF